VIRVVCCGPEGENYSRDFDGSEFCVAGSGELEIYRNTALVAVVSSSDWICAELVEVAN
jgi:hypothetical protein